MRQKRAKPINGRIKTVKDKVLGFFTKKSIITLNCVIAGILSYAMAYLFIHPSAYISSEGSDFGSEFSSLRQSINETGDPNYKSISITGEFRTNNLIAKDFEDPEYGKFKVAVDKGSDDTEYFEYSFLEKEGEDNYLFMFQVNNQFTQILTSEYFVDTENQPFFPFIIDILLTDESGTPITFEKQTDRGPVQRNISALATADAECAIREFAIVDCPKTIDKDTLYERFLSVTERCVARIPSLAKSSGIQNQQTFFNKLSSFVETRFRNTIFPVLGVIIGFLAVPFTAIAIASGGFYLREEKRKRLIGLGIIDKNGEFTEAYSKQKEPEEKRIKKPRGHSFDSFIEKKGIKPVLGEWFFRVAGLILVLIANIIFYYANRAISGQDQNQWLLDFYDNTMLLFQAFEEIGIFILVICVVQIISETKRNLARSTYLFLALAILYYFGMCGLLYFLDMFLMIPGVAVANTLIDGFPGNVFLGIGIFSFLGFFLFYNPPEWIINRKVFRWLSVIPLLIAVGSIAITLLSRFKVITVSYWALNFLFIRDFNGLFVGICLEIVIFLFQRHYEKRYGEKAKIVLDKPYTQFKKNALLCGLILIYVILFYVTPVSVKEALQVKQTYTFVFMTIPFFLFYKPSKENHNSTFDIIYYVLYVFALYGPKILQYAIGLFA